MHGLCVLKKCRGSLLFYVSSLFMPSKLLLLCRDFLNPILLVTLFLPGDRVSAAAALGCLYYFALANQVSYEWGISSIELF